MRKHLVAERGGISRARGLRGGRAVRPGPRALPAPGEGVGSRAEAVPVLRGGAGRPRRRRGRAAHAHPPARRPVGRGPGGRQARLLSEADGRHGRGGRRDRRRGGPGGDGISGYRELPLLPAYRQGQGAARPGRCRRAVAAADTDGPAAPGPQTPARCGSSRAPSSGGGTPRRTRAGRCTTTGGTSSLPRCGGSGLRSWSPGW